MPGLSPYIGYVLSGYKHSDVVIVHHLAIAGDGKVGGDIPCGAYEGTFPCGNAPDDGAPLESGNWTRPQAPGAYRLECQLAMSAVVNAASLLNVSPLSTTWDSNATVSPCGPLPAVIARRVLSLPSTGAARPLSSIAKTTSLI